MLLKNTKPNENPITTQNWWKITKKILIKEVGESLFRYFRIRNTFWEKKNLLDIWEKSPNSFFPSSASYRILLYWYPIHAAFVESKIKDGPLRWLWDPFKMVRLMYELISHHEILICWPFDVLYLYPIPLNSMQLWVGVNIVIVKNIIHPNA